MIARDNRPFFRVCRLRGEGFDVESHPFAELRDIVGVRLYMSGQNVWPSQSQVTHWAELARAAPGHPVDCLYWKGEGDDRKPVAAARIIYVIPTIKGDSAHENRAESKSLA